MSITTLFLAVVLTGAIIYYVLSPFLESQPDRNRNRAAPRGTARQTQALETLDTEKRRVLRAIRDLDLDYDMDKLIDSTYAAQRIYLIRLAVAIIQRMDTLEAEVAEQEARIEEAIASYRRAR